MKTSVGLYYLASGLLFALGFIDWYFFWTFVPAFVLFYRAIAKTGSIRTVFLGGLVVGTCIYLGSFFWVWSSVPVLWMSDQPLWIHICAVFFYWILTSVVSGIGCGVFAVLIKKIVHTPVVMVCVAPLVWLCSEIMRSLIFSVYTWGEGSLINADFSFGYVGYNLATTPLTLFFASIAGVYGLSYLASCIGSVAYALYIGTQEEKKYTLGIFTLIVVLFVGVSIVSSPQQDDSLGITVVSIDTVFDKDFNSIPNAKNIKQEAVQTALQEAFLHDPHTIILPEDVRISDYFTSREELFSWIRSHAQGSLVSIVDNGPEIDARGKTVIRTYIYDVQEEAVYFFDKKYLVPQGEFMSYIHAFIVGLFVEDEALALIQKQTGMHAGVIDDSKAIPEYLPGVLFCFETMVPLSVRRIESMRSHQFIAHSISHSWFRNPTTLEFQLDTMMKVHAVWNDVPLISAGNMSEGSLYLPSGDIEDGEVQRGAPLWTVRTFEL